MFVYFFILNLISNSAFLLYNQSFWALFCMVNCAGLVAYIEDFFVSKIKRKNVSVCFIVLFALFHSLLILGDYFLIINFRMLLNQDVVDILSETNAEQTEDFIQTYLHWWIIVAWIFAILLLNFIAMFINNIKIGFNKILLLFVFGGVFVFGFCGFSYIRYGDGKSIPQFVAPIRLSYSLYVLKERISAIENLRMLCLEVKAYADIDHAPNVIVVIGESFSKYHCSLYGYKKQTYPFLEARKDGGEVVVMNDAVAIGDATHRNMLAIFSLGDGNSTFSFSPLFPVCFRKAGYKTVMYDNQYFLGHGITFLSDEKLSDILFNYRNDRGYEYDEEMIKTIKKENKPALYVIHLWGQHYAYENRYPKEFAFFSAQDYDDDSHASIIAHYDNACLYNDHAINQIIKLFEKDDAIVVYFSDHGEEVYELGYMGHGTSTSTKDIRYQLAVPFIIWTSELFKNRHSKVYESLSKSENVPIMTQDVGHLLLDIANIQTEVFQPERSFINAKYDSIKHRIVMNSIDYDAEVSRLKIDSH